MFCNKAKIAIKKALKFIDDKLNVALDVALKVTTLLKNPLVKFAVNLLPEIPGFSKQQILSFIENAFEKVSEIDKCRYLTGEDKINCYLQQLHVLPTDKKNAVLIKLKSLITSQLDGKRFEGKFYDTAAQVNYLISKTV